MLLTMDADTFDLNLTLDKGKGAFWHADDGVLVMGGAEDPRRRTVYYSYTNLPTAGEVSLHDPHGDQKTTVSSTSQLATIPRDRRRWS